MNKIAGKVVIVTGASSGIGAATARELVRRGATVVLAARRRAALDRLVAELTNSGGMALAITTDMTNPQELDHLVATTIGQYGWVDVLLNNAGVGADQSLDELPAEALQAMIDTNLLAPIQLARAVIPHMRKQGGGQIINTGSVASHIATPGVGVYAATKFGLRGFSDGLRRELQRDRITVSLVSPGFIRTDMTKGLIVPMSGPEVVARAVIGVIERPRREVVVPGIYRIFIWIQFTAPWLVDWLLRFVNRKAVQLFRAQ